MYINRDLDQLAILNRERHRELLRMAEHHRLLSQLKAQPQRSHSLYHWLDRCIPIACAFVFTWLTTLRRQFIEKQKQQAARYPSHAQGE